MSCASNQLPLEAEGMASKSDIPVYIFSQLINHSLDLFDVRAAHHDLAITQPKVTCLGCFSDSKPQLAISNYDDEHSRASAFR